VVHVDIEPKQPRGALDVRLIGQYFYRAASLLEKSDEAEISLECAF
jgi:hypothetical protein